jgi:hypothetical protein
VLGGGALKTRAFIQLAGLPLAALPVPSARACGRLGSFPAWAVGSDGVRGWSSRSLVNRRFQAGRQMAPGRLLKLPGLKKGLAKR